MASPTEHVVQCSGTTKLTMLRKQPDVMAKRVTVLKAGQTATWVGPQDPGDPHPIHWTYFVDHVLLRLLLLLLPPLPPPLPLPLPPSLLLPLLLLLHLLAPVLLLLLLLLLSCSCCCSLPSYSSSCKRRLFQVCPRSP